MIITWSKLLCSLYKRHNRIHCVFCTPGVKPHYQNKCVVCRYGTITNDTVSPTSLRDSYKPHNRNQYSMWFATPGVQTVSLYMGGGSRQPYCELNGHSQMKFLYIPGDPLFSRPIVNVEPVNTMLDRNTIPSGPSRDGRIVRFVGQGAWGNIGWYNQRQVNSHQFKTL